MKERYSEVAKQMFAILAVTGVVVVVAAAPGAVLALKLFEQNGRKFPKNCTQKQVTRSLHGLQSKKYIEIKEKSGKFEIRLTKKGKEKFKETQVNDIKITRPSHWDQKWRIVIFGIPDRSYKWGREILREKLKQWNFYQLQKSVWVCPWPCEDEVYLVAELHGLLPYLNIIVADHIIDDVPLRKHFRL